jgi:hypothetical protein
MTDDLIDVVDRAGRRDPHYEELADRLRDETTRSSSGPGAGPEVTAGGVFADLLQFANYLGATL